MQPGMTHGARGHLTASRPLARWNVKATEVPSRGTRNDPLKGEIRQPGETNRKSNARLRLLAANATCVRWERRRNSGSNSSPCRRDWAGFPHLKGCFCPHRRLVPAVHRGAAICRIVASIECRRFAPGSLLDVLRTSQTIFEKCRNRPDFQADSASSRRL